MTSTQNERPLAGNGNQQTRDRTGHNGGGRDQIWRKSVPGVIQVWFNVRAQGVWQSLFIILFIFHRI